MPFAHAQMLEAEKAVEFAVELFPLIDPRGIAPYHEPYEPNQHSFDTETGLQQVATAIEFLLQNGIAPASDSYGLKHDAERWGRDNGFVPYVSNGALIVAAIYLGFELDGDFDGNVFIG